MNSYERYVGMINGQKVDCVPRIPILMHFAAKYINTSYANFARDHRVMFQANKALVLDFGFDQLDIMSDPWRETTAFGGQIEYLENTIPKCTYHPLGDTKNLASLDKPNPATSERLKTAILTIDAYKDFAWKKYSITGWVEGPIAEAVDLRGVEKFLLDLYDDQMFCCELMDICTNVAVEYATEQLKHGCDTIGIGDAIASQISADMYEKFVLPREKRIIDAIHDNGGLARLHICGDINHLLPLMALLNIDILDCDWMVDMAKARKLLASNVTLAGNLDPVQEIMNSTPEKIKRKSRAIYEEVGNPYLVNAGCEIPVGTPVENLRAFCEPIPMRI
ncbi:MAG: uroporphyrinogen decarboxylase family protein [Planctomycetota bacterium]|jgi:MtaA/CmuA family methyltransferase